MQQQPFSWYVPSAAALGEAAIHLCTEWSLFPIVCLKLQASLVVVVGIFPGEGHLSTASCRIPLPLGAGLTGAIMAALLPAHEECLWQQKHTLVAGAPSQQGWLKK